MIRTALTLVLILAVNAAIPSPALAQDEGFQITTTDVGVVVGVGGLSGASASIGGRFEKAFKELPNLANGILGIGVAVDWYRHSFSDTFVSSRQVFTYGYDFTYIPIAVTVNYHYPLPNNRRLDPFAGVGLGYLHASASDTGTACNVSGCSSSSYDSGIYPVFHIGMRYYWKPGWTLYADAGAGYGALHGGVVFKLPGID